MRSPLHMPLRALVVVLVALASCGGEVAGTVGTTAAGCEASCCEGMAQPSACELTDAQCATLASRFHDDGVCSLEVPDASTFVPIVVPTVPPPFDAAPVEDAAAMLSSGDADSGDFDCYGYCSSMCGGSPTCVGTCEGRCRPH